MSRQNHTLEKEHEGLGGRRPGCRQGPRSLVHKGSGTKLLSTKFDGAQGGKTGAAGRRAPSSMSTSTSHSLVRMHVRTEDKPKEGPEAPTTESKAVATWMRAVPTAGAARKGLTDTTNSFGNTCKVLLPPRTKLADRKLASSLEAYGSKSQRRRSTLILDR